MKIQNKSKHGLEKSSFFITFRVVSPRHFGRPPLRYPLKSPSKLISITKAELGISADLKQKNSVCTGDERQGSALLSFPGFFHLKLRTLCLCIDLPDHNAIDNGITDHHGARDDHSRHLNHIPYVHVVGRRSEHLHRDLPGNGHNELRTVQEQKNVPVQQDPGSGQPARSYFH
jgi:hypothetical protein